MSFAWSASFASPAVDSAPPRCGRRLISGFCSSPGRQTPDSDREWRCRKTGKRRRCTLAVIWGFQQTHSPSRSGQKSPRLRPHEQIQTSIGAHCSSLEIPGEPLCDDRCHELAGVNGIRTIACSLQQKPGPLRLWHWVKAERPCAPGCPMATPGSGASARYSLSSGRMVIGSIGASNTLKSGLTFKRHCREFGVARR